MTTSTTQLLLRRAQTYTFVNMPLSSTTGHASAALGRQMNGFEHWLMAWSSPRPDPPWPTWRQWPAYAGRSRSVLSAPRMISDLIIARLGPGTDGIAT